MHYLCDAMHSLPHWKLALCCVHPQLHATPCLLMFAFKFQPICLLLLAFIVQGSVRYIQSKLFHEWCIGLLFHLMVRSSSHFAGVALLCGRALLGIFQYFSSQYLMRAPLQEAAKEKSASEQMQRSKGKDAKRGQGSIYVPYGMSYACFVVSMKLNHELV